MSVECGWQVWGKLEGRGEGREGDRGSDDARVARRAMAVDVFDEFHGKDIMRSCGGVRKPRGIYCTYIMTSHRYGVVI